MDTKDDILIIASEQERVKMNVYEWLESPDVREYLEGIHYEFTLPEAFYVIRENEQRALEEKIAAWEELLDIMPDCPFSIESELGEKLEIDSFHQALREYVAQQRGLLEDVCRRDENGVYGVIMPTAYRKAKGVALSEFLENNWKEFEGKGTLRLTKTWSGKQRHNGILFFCVNAEKQACGHWTGPRETGRCSTRFCLYTKPSTTTWSAS